MTPIESETAPVRVAPAPSGDAAYDVVVEAGVLLRLSEHAVRVCHAAAYAVISDETVAGLYGDAVCGTLARRAPAHLFTFPAGEANKTRETWAKLTDALLGQGIGRDGCIIALGGGVTGDLAGFVAATYMRGIPWIQAPTSLLAMIDASVGGKTGVDVPAGKNLVGAFTQPRIVLADPAVLRTLPPDEVRAGLAEAIKHGCIADGAYLGWIEANAEALVAAEPTLTGQLVRRSVEIKARVVSADPHEHGERATLNFGHTVAHAIERLTSFAVPHGHAVAMGMVAEARIGEHAGLTAAGTADRIAGIVARMGLPTRIPRGIDAGALMDAAATDKKARRAHVRWALLATIGRPARGEAGEWTVDVAPETVQTALHS